MHATAAKDSTGALPFAAVKSEFRRGTGRFPRLHGSRELAAKVCADAAEPAHVTRTLLANEILFKEGDVRSHIYRIETGAVCVFVPRWDEEHVDIEFAFRGDYVGFGYLKAHTHTARATAETRVICLPLSEVDSIVEGDRRAEAKLADAIEKDLNILRDSLIQSAHLKPAVRLAALLTTLSQGNKQEGRDPSLITDSVTCGTVADYLSLSIEGLHSLLVGLEARGLIAPCPPQGLRLKDIEALETLANGLSPGRTMISGEVRCGS